MNVYNSNNKILCLNINHFFLNYENVDNDTCFIDFNICDVECKICM